MIFPQIQIVPVAVNVSLDEGVATFTYNGCSELIIDVFPNTQLMLRLMLDPASGALFVTNPFDWFIGTPQQPILTPPSFTVHRDTDTFCTILDFNPARRKTTEAFRFTISVQLDGKVYTSSDPTIINHKPS